MSEDILLEKIKYLTDMSHSSLVEHCIYLEQENDNYKAQKYITDFITENGIICEKNKQIQELTNNWNELEEWLQNEYNEWSTVDDEIIRAEARQCIEVLDKMKEIKEGKND